MTVVNPKSISGINSITMASGSDNLLTIHTTNTTERVRVNSDGDVIVGSGITVSPDGDIFATGVTTSTTFVGNLTGNVTGTLQTAAQTNITSVGSLSSLVVTGGITATGGNVVMNDSSGSSANRIKLGTSQDLSVYHDGTDSIISNATGDLYINNTGGSSDDVHIQAADDILLRPQGGENGIKVIGDGAVELYQNNVLKVTTADEGLIVYSGSGAGSNTGNVISVKGGTSARTAPGIYMEGGTGGDNSSIHAKYNLRLGCNSGNDISSREVQFTNGDTNLGSFNSNGDFEIDNGNLVMGTSGKGIDFSATSGGSGGSNVSELFSDFETGTFSLGGPVIGGGSISVGCARYTRVGNICHVFVSATMSTSGQNYDLQFSGLPFASSSTNSTHATIGTNKSGLSNGIRAQIASSSSIIMIRSQWADDGLKSQDFNGYNTAFNATYIVG